MIQDFDIAAFEGARRYCSPETEARLRELIGGRYNGAHRFGSGDFHYMTKLFCDCIEEPFELLLFDHHPDMQKPAFEGVMSCGGWLRDLLETNPLLQHATIVGIAPELLCETEGFPGRLTVYPEGSTVIPAPSTGLPLYISVDKDVFCSCAARTNWDQGSLDLPTFASIAEMLSAGRRILGVDICGELPPEEGGTAEDSAVNRRADEFIVNLFKDRLI